VLNNESIPVSRLGIFVFYDKEGIVDDYVLHLLDGMMENLNHLVIVCNGKVEETGLAKLEKYTRDVFIRDNTGYDSTAWKATLTSLYGWDKVYSFDELVLFNDTFYGPIYPFKDMFDEMSVRDSSDFWGITLQNNLLIFDNIVTPVHLQSYFLVFREKILKSKDFFLFFENLGQINNYNDAVRKFEIILTQHFAELGYKFDSYIDINPFASNKTENNYNYSVYEAFNLIYKYKCPIVKRKNFITLNGGLLNLNGGVDAAKTLNYIEKHTKYNADLIWSNILRIYNISEIHSALHLDYILPANVNTRGSDLLEIDYAAVFILIFHDKFLVEWTHFIKQIPKGIEIYVTTNNQSVKNKLSDLLGSDADYKCHIQLFNCDAATILPFLIENKHIILKYKYIGFIHENQELGQYGPYIIDETLMNNMWENTLKSPEYIENIIDEFEKHNKLGLLMPPMPYHSQYFGMPFLEWRENHGKVKLFADVIGLKCDINADAPPFSFVSCFWGRTSILNKLLDVSFEPSLLNSEYMDNVFKMILPYLAQDKGYYSGTVMNDNYASLQMSMQNFMLNGLNRNSDVIGYLNLIEKEEIGLLIDFCKKNKRNYIYGAGVMGRKYAQYLTANGIGFEGFIISDGRPKESHVNDHPIYYLSETRLQKDKIGVIIAMKDQTEVTKILNSEGIKNVFKVLTN
jgi:lipopolysaccharide biosynthesis protein